MSRLGQEGRPDATAVTISVIVTVLNEGKNIRHLLDSLLHQDLHELIVVDAGSTDHTLEVLQRYEARLPLKLIQKPCRRGEGRNIGARHATGDVLAFIDGDCIANAEWLRSMAQASDGKSVLAGRTITLGFWAFAKLVRVELPHKGHDTTWPSCNLAYPRALFETLDGFDGEFVTAEDIDLNYRAINAGASIVHVPEAIVYARARESITSFLRQAYWNGYGRKQLTRKHGRLWHEYKISELVRIQGGSFWGLLRMAWGLIGYLDAKLGRRPPS